MKKQTLWILVLAFAVLIGGASVLYTRLGAENAADQMVVHESSPAADASQKAASAEESAAVPAPDFTVYDKAGAPVRLSQYSGKPIVLNFWASWCGPCQYEMPDFNEKYLELGDEVHFMMVNMTDGGRETIETASAFITKNGYSFPVLFDTQSEAAAAYGAYSLPTTFFISADGRIIAQAVGAIDAQTLQSGIDMILK